MRFDIRNRQQNLAILSARRRLCGQGCDRGAYPVRVNKGTPTDTIRTTAAGNMGVGLSNPSTKLDVDGPVRPKS